MEYVYEILELVLCSDLFFNGVFNGVSGVAVSVSVMRWFVLAVLYVELSLPTT